MAADLTLLMGRVAAGDEQAFAAVYDATAQHVFGLASRLVRDRGEAVEVSREVYLAVWCSARSFDASRGGAMPWILVKAHRAAVGRARSSRSRAERDRPMEDPRHSEELDPHELAYASVAAERVGAALDRLTFEQRQAVELAYFGGHTNTEVAWLTRVPPCTATSRIRAGLIRLSGVLDGRSTSSDDVDDERGAPAARSHAGVAAL